MIEVAASRGVKTINVVRKRYFPLQSAPACASLDPLLFRKGSKTTALLSTILTGVFSRRRHNWDEVSSRLQAMGGTIVTSLDEALELSSACSPSKLVRALR